MNKQGGNSGGRTGLHGRHLPRLPLGNVGIEGSSISKHYPSPETSKTMDTKKVEGKKGCKNTTNRVGELKRNQKKHISDTIQPTNSVEQRGGRTVIHGRHFGHVPITHHTV